MIDIALFLKLSAVWADVFQYTRTEKVEIIKEYAGAYGIEKIHTGEYVEHTFSLADNILHTAQAMTCGGTDIERGLKYLDMFKKKSVQRSELKNAHFI